MAASMVGIDLGGTKIQGVVVDHLGTPLGRAVASTPVTGGPSSVIAQVAAVVAAAAADAGVAVATLDGVGMGSPGRVDAARGEVAGAANVPGFSQPVRVTELLAKALDLAPEAVRVDNDVNVATLAEQRLGAGRGIDDLLAVFAGTGVGGGLVLDGRLRRGVRGAAGELGHIVVVQGGALCTCGRRGCTEAYAGRTAMEHAARDAAAAGRPTELLAIQRRLGRARLTTDVLVEALVAGDQLAEELVERAARAIGTAIGSSVNIVDVRAVLLGGGLVDALGERFVAAVRRAMEPVLFANDPPVEVRTTALGDLAGAIGAALLVHESTPSS